MIVKDIFNCCSCFQDITLVDFDGNVLFHKDFNKPLGRCEYFDNEVFWINCINYENIWLCIED